MCEVCEETFAIRAKHAWPPKIITYAQWSEPLEQLAKEMGLPNETAAEIVQHVTEYIQRIPAYPPGSKRRITPSVPTA